MTCSLDGPLASRVEPSNLSSQGRQEQHHIATVGEPILPQPEAPYPFALQVPASPQVLLVVLPDGPR